jgi:hypothetical protein
MSFRIHATDYKMGEDSNGNGNISHQVYGNHEFPEKLRDYLISNGAELDGDDCFTDHEVTDIQELLEVMFEIHHEQVEDDSYWDFKPSAIYKTDTVDELISYIDYKLYASIVMTMYNFYKAFEDSITSYWDKESNSPKYKLKDGMKIYLSGF